MKRKTIDEINEIYDLELDKVIETIKKNKFKKVLFQFPEGIKLYSIEIINEIELKTNCKCFIWMDSCFGACDIPVETEKMGIDLIIQFGHSSWKFFRKDIRVLN